MGGKFELQSSKDFRAVTLVASDKVISAVWLIGGKIGEFNSYIHIYNLNLSVRLYKIVFFFSLDCREEKF